MAKQLPDKQFILALCEAIDEAIRCVAIGQVDEAQGIIKQTADTLLTTALFHEDKELYNTALQFYALMAESKVN